MKDIFTRSISRILLIFLSLLSAADAFAQYTKTTLEQAAVGISSGRYTAITKDKQGNIYLVRLNAAGTNYEVVKYTNGAGTAQVIYGNLIKNSPPNNYPWGLAVNDAGDVFVTNPNQTSQWEIIKLSPPGYIYSPTSSIIQSGRYFSALAIDNDDKLLALEYLQATDSYRLVRYNSFAQNAGLQEVWSGIPYPTSSTISLPSNIAVDSHDNIYVTGFLDATGGQIVKVTPAGVASTVATGRAFTGIAVDINDNFYTSEAVLSDPNRYQVVKYTSFAAAGEPIYTQLHQTSLYDYPWGLTVTPNGKVYANDGENGGEVVILSPPTISVTSITRLSNNPTASNTVVFRVTFSGAASNVTASSFSLTTTGLTGSSIGSVVQNSATEYDVTVVTGTGTAGTVRLDVNGTGISPIVTPVPYTSGPSYTIDRVPPTGSVTINGGAAYTNSPNFTLTLTGSDASTPMQMAFSTDGSSFTGDEPFATTKNFTLAATDGTQTITVRLKDAAGNTTTFSDNIILDRVAPNTAIGTRPTDPSNSSTATFTFSANEPNCTFTGRLDGGPANPVTSPITFTGLADGPHTFQVAATDAAGNVDASPDGYLWVIDATGPQITSVGVPANEYYHAGQSLAFKVIYNEAAFVDQTAGTPYINIIIGLDAVQVPYTGGTGTNELTFTYVVQQGEMDMDGIQVQPLVQNNSGTIKDALGNNASTTLQNVAATNLVRVNTSIPSVTLSFVGTTMPTNTPFTVRAVFSEAVTGLTVSDFNVLNTTVSLLFPIDNITYDVVMTPASDGTRTISLPSGAVENIGHNPNTSSNTLTYTYDATAPSVTSVTVPSPQYYKVGETMAFTVNFSEDIIVNTTGGSPRLPLTIGLATVNAAYSSSTSNSITFTYTVAAGDMDMDGITIGALNLNGSTIKDAATNNANLTLNGVPSTGNVRVNTSHPTTTITSTAPAIVNAPFNATINFSESVTNFAPTDITVTNGVVQGFTQITGSTYIIQIAPSAEGTVAVQVAADMAQNIGGNGNTASNTLSRIYDTAPPAVTSVTVPANGYYKAGQPLNFTVRFSENITLNTTSGTPTLNLTIGSTVVNTTYTGLNGTNGLNFSYTVVDGDMDSDGIAVNDLVLNNATIVDVANNAALLVLNGVPSTAGVFVNTQHPTVTLSTTTPALVNGPVTVTATFSEAVTGLDVSDFNLTNVASAILTGTGTTYTLVVTPAANGPVSISLDADNAVNIGNNGNTASNTLNFTYDGTAPAVTSVAVPPNDYYNAGTTLNFIVRFNENLVINISGGTPTLTLNIGGTNVNAGFTSQNGTNGLNFQYTILDGQSDMDGIQVVSLNTAGSTIRDAATNNANLTLNNVGNTSFVRVNTTHPTVTLSTPATPSMNTPFTVNIAFSENVTGFTSAGISVTNGSSSPVTVIDNAHYSVIIVPASEGPVTINVPADKAQNIGHNGNTASNTLTVNYDITAPKVAAVAVPASKYYKAGDVLNFTVNFDEDFVLNTTGGNPYLALTIGSQSVQAAYTGVSTNRELNFSYTVVNGNEDTDGITVNALNANGSTIRDAATNDANLTLNNIGITTGVLVNTTSPTVVLSSAAPALLNAPFTVTATFSEAVAVLTADDLTITNGTASNVQSTDNITYTVTITPTADGALSVQLPANKAVNIGGNPNIASNTLNFTYDGTAPTVTAVTVPTNGYYKAGDVLNFTVRFSENIQLSGGTPSLDVILTTGTVKANYTTATANSLAFSYTVQPGDMDLNGIALGTAISLNGSSIKDNATNNAILTLNNIAATSGVFVHTGSPSVQLSTTAASRVNAPFTVTAVFNEAVTGLIAADFNVTNGTASNVQTGNNITYTLIITPTADGNVSVTLPAAQAQNVVNNGNTASNTITLLYDHTAPAIATGLAFEILERSTVGTQVGKVTATDASGILQNWTIATDNSNGAFAIDANGNITVADQAKLNSMVNNTVTLGITVSDGLNTSVAVPVTIQVKMVNQAPTLNAIANTTICPDGQEHTIQLSGAATVEPGQTYTFNILTDKASNFDKLSVSAAGVITYQLKTSATGIQNVIVTIKDNGGTANGGIDTLRRSFNIEVATLGAVTITSDKGNTISKGDIIHLTATGGTHYEWDNAAGIISGQQTSVLEARPMLNTTYHVTVSNDLGCKNTADFAVTVVADFKVDATNILTPNGDGRNDKWVIRNLDSYPNNEVKIFDRSGRMVYSRKNYSNDWDATVNGAPLSTGTYYYILSIENGAKVAKGYITIVREQ
ncbi:Ig-like domain-containing protein [Chitinophaga sp. sic0106]|uniref:Ig-like domain-containing protein n=1 Tax=Chitinophaga sp. sic0106 TaxID=2854785 RepID=UPI001C47BDBA|nr:Ig-like domain-containing protein [Chitinophaga sp. sic0106]MBV7530969.1 gliding motility-associated C-terminal domain-containing protein [Chitinophaga sp. sic0106]